MKNILFAGLAAGSLVFSSCGDKKADTGVNKDNLKANEAVENWKKDMTEGRVASLWDSLPESYQSDVTKVIHTFGGKMDAEVYNEAMKTVSAAAALLKDKKSIVLEMAKEMTPPDAKSQVELATTSYDSIVGLLGAIANSDAKDIDGLKKLDVASLLGDVQEHTMKLTDLATLADIGTDMNKLKTMTTKLISEEGDAAEVEVELDGDKEKVKLVKKDGRWLPEDVVKDWSKAMEEANKELGQMADMKPMQKEEMLKGLRMVQGVIKDLEGVNSKEDMQKMMPAIMGKFMGM